MKELGFRNFRKFTNLKPISLGNLNILVGANNSGKSSFIKACILTQLNFNRMENLMIVPLTDISFDNPLDAHLHLGDAKSNLTSFSQSEEMEFSVSYEKYSIRYIMDCGGQMFEGPSILAPLKSLTIKNEEIGSTLQYDFKKNKLTYITLKVSSEDMLRFIDKFQTSLWREYRKSAYGDGPDQFAIIAKAREKYIGEEREVINTWKFRNNSTLDRSLDKINKNGLEIRWLFEESLILVHQYHCDIEYIETHNAPHNAILYTEDKNNYLVQTVARFMSSSAYRCDQDRTFILKWMKELNVGEDFKITCPYPEVIQVDILANGIWRPLGFMGTGSVQMFILLLRLVMARQSDFTHKMLFVEEPEQNLHPALQSKLADMFHEYMDISGTTVFVETHSEYLVRRLQVIASDLMDSDKKKVQDINSEIKVYYFPSENKAPYSMEFTESGHFARQFGPGFFDEAGKNYRTLLLKRL